MADTAAPVADSAPAAAAATARPVKPDEAVFQKQLEKAEKEHKDVMVQFNAIKAQIELVLPNKAKDGSVAAQTPAQKRRQELLDQLGVIRKKQAGGKSARTSKQEQIKRLDEQLRSRIAEQKAARGKLSFKSVDDLDRHIQRLDDEVNGGMMRLVDEKKALAEITSLKKTRKNFAQFDVQEKQIADLRASIKQIKDGLDDPAARALSDEYNALQAELDQIKAEQDGVYKNLSKLRDERSRLHTEQREKFDAIRKLKDAYYGQKKAFAAYEREARQKAWERKQAERDRIERDRKKERAQRMLAEAADPAYLDEIRRGRSLLHFFDPTAHAAAPAASPAATNGSGAASSLSAQATRKVDDSGLKGTRLVRKEDRDEMYLPAKKTSAKKSRHANGTNGTATTTASSSKGFNVPPAVIEDCAAMGIDPPISQADVAAVMDKVKAKIAHWEADQAAQTQRNVEKAKKEIEKLEKEEAAQANGDAVSEVTADLKKSTLHSDKTEETVKVAPAIKA